MAAHALVALARANARYWTTVAPVARAQIAHWERRAQAIPDPLRRTIAVRKLREERFNVEAATTLATPAVRARRQGVTRAIVALQVAYDYLDALDEQSHLRAAECLDPFDERAPFQIEDGYARELSASARAELARLPAARAVEQTARRAAARCAHAQALAHSASRSNEDEVRRWAGREAAGAALHWREFLAGAQASVLSVHALIAAAADSRTSMQDAEQIDEVYLRIGALTMLDSLIDREQDLARGDEGFLRYYDCPQEMARGLATVAHETIPRAYALPNGAHHVMTLAGVIAYYGSVPAALDRFAVPVTGHLCRELRPLVTPPLAVMRAWRRAKPRQPRPPSGPAWTGSRRRRAPAA